MKLYDKVKKILEADEQARNSDKHLIWKVFESTSNGRDFMTYQDFIKMPAFESITRARRKIQELHIELRPNMTVQRGRIGKARQKGKFVYREKTGHYGKDGVYYEN